MAFKTDLDALILGVLQREPLHGYEIAKRINSANENLFRVGESKLYPALHKLEDKALIESSWIHEEGKKPRKVYTLTQEGTKELEKRKKTWEKFAAGVASIMTNPRTAEGKNG